MILRCLGVLDETVNEMYQGASQQVALRPPTSKGATLPLWSCNLKSLIWAFFFQNLFCSLSTLTLSASSNLKVVALQCFFLFLWPSFYKWCLKFVKAARKWWVKVFVQVIIYKNNCCAASSQSDVYYLSISNNMHHKFYSKKLWQQTKQYK